MSNAYSLMDRPSIGEMNGLVDPLRYHKERQSQAKIRTVDWATPGLRITRLRLVSDPGFPLWDVSYCHGMLDGKHVDVDLPFSQLPKGRDPKTGKSRLYAALYAYAKKSGRFINGLFDSISTLN